MYVADASVIPANVGVNLSLTITAPAEGRGRLPTARRGLGTTRRCDCPPDARDRRLLRRRWPGSSPPPSRPSSTRSSATSRRPFVALLTHVAGPGLVLLGLLRWFGKRFRTSPSGGVGMNLIRRGDGLAETLPMQPCRGHVAGRPAPHLCRGRALAVALVRDEPPRRTRRC
ncbi:MAG: hypothetical protein U0R78_15450 [Nocardioidaceae bacterium]